MAIEDEPFEVRRAYVRRRRQQLLANPPGVAATDQYAAAARHLSDNWDKAIPWVEDLTGGYGCDVRVDEAVEAEEMLHAALLTCRPCVHLGPGSSPMPTVAQLPLYRVACTSCAQTIGTPPEGEDDRCDICGSRGHKTFWPLMYMMGPIVFAGNMASCCAPDHLWASPSPRRFRCALDDWVVTSTGPAREDPGHEHNHV
jgi:hypothetical protein